MFSDLKKDFIISTDKSKIDIAAVHNYLSKESYWAKNISLDTCNKSQLTEPFVLAFIK